MQEKSARFALLCYNGTDNIGDEVQSLAARRFLPSVDCFVDREKLNDYSDSNERFFIILNGWYCHRPENWPPSRRLIPLLISMHLAPYPVGHLGLIPSEHLLRGDNAQYLRAHGPVGTRDRNTLALMKSAGIDAYFSGCLTLTLPKLEVEKQEYAVACDVDEDILTTLTSKSKCHVERVSHVGYEKLNQEARFRKAADLLKYYAAARCVITTRIHCALPCLAMGVPVLFVNNGQDGGRFWGLIELLHNCTLADVRGGRVSFDIDSPPANPTDFVPIRQALIDRTTRFVQDAVQSKPYAAEQ